MNTSLFDERDMIQRENHATRIPVVLCLDTSGSMENNGGIHELNKAVNSFYYACKNNAIDKYGFDVAMVSFGIQGVHREQDFRPIWNQTHIPQFVVEEKGKNCGTPLGQGVDLAMQGLDERKREYKANAIGYRQPWLVIISDGAPTDDDTPEYANTVHAVINLQKRKKLSVIAIGVGREKVAEYRKLARFVVDGKVLTTWDFSELPTVFEFLSQSISTQSTLLGSDFVETSSPVALLAEELEEEGLSIQIEDFGRDCD